MRTLLGLAKANHAISRGVKNQPAATPTVEECPLVGFQTKASWLRIVGVAFLLLIWTFASSLQLARPLVLPSPLSVFAAAQDIGPVLILHTLSTIGRIVVGVSLGTWTGFALGMTMQYSRTAFLLLDGIVETARPVPPVAVVPFFILVFGFA